jgi:predicted nuclease of predicted toxin-antitoxin system
MRVLVDECIGPVVSRWLQEMGFDAVSIFDDARGATDDEVARRAFEESRILITLDKDFGDAIYHGRRPHHGVILLRLADERPVVKIDVLQRLLALYTDRLADHFVVVTETSVRFAKGR